jgi:hypothetical protein
LSKLKNEKASRKLLIRLKIGVDRALGGHLGSCDYPRTDRPGR